MLKLISLPTSKSLREVLQLYSHNLTNITENRNGTVENQALLEPVEGLAAAKAIADKMTKLVSDLDHPELPFPFYERLVEQAFELMKQANSLLWAGGI